MLAALTGLGIGTPAFQRALAAQASEKGAIDSAMIQNAEWIAGLELTDDERQETASQLRRTLRSLNYQRSIEIDHSVAPAVAFRPGDSSSSSEPVRRQTSPRPRAGFQRPSSDDDLAFLSVAELSSLIHSRAVSSVELTNLYLSRLRKFDSVLKCVVTLTEELALKQAKRADAELANGHSRGPLHGIPWGAKDLIAVPGYPTTWGATPYREQELDTTATVASRLEEAGAVLVAKLSLGALASGDRWFGGQTRNPWNPEEGSSGSSAGSTSAAVAGLVGFAIGSETHGSIVSPCKRCGASGLRPTFGRISRHGCMTLSWSMDKLGPIARSLEDCAIIFDAIHGSDGHDSSAVSRPYRWPSTRPNGQLRVGFVKSEQERYSKELDALRGLGVELKEVKLPNQISPYPLTTILYVEASTAHDELVRSGTTEGLNSWPQSLRAAQFIPAVEYVRANRLRTMIMEELNAVFDEVDMYLGGNDLTMTNLTGHPTVVFPHGTIERRGKKVPGSLTMTGRLYGESELLTVADKLQRHFGDNLKHPDLQESVEDDPESES